jgi:hypothetical protein
VESVAPFLAIVITHGVYSFWRRSRQCVYMGDYDFPSGLRKKFNHVHPGLTAAQQDQVFEGLRQWLMVCNHAKRQCVSMPSQVIDEAWHAFILFMRNDEPYCRKAFDRFVHHTPAEAMIDQTSATDGIKQTWRIACNLGGIDPKNLAMLPALVATDAALGIANGSHYEIVRKPGSYPDCAGGIGCGGYGEDGHTVSIPWPALCWRPAEKLTAWSALWPMTPMPAGC